MVQKIPPTTINWVNNFYFSKIQFVVDMNFDDGRIDSIDSVSYKPSNDYANFVSRSTKNCNSELL